MDAEALLVASSIYARFILGGVFLWAGIAKLRRRTTFERAVAEFDLLPHQIVPVVSRTVPLVEVGFGALLILGFGTRWVATAALLVLFGFTLAAFVALHRGQKPSCQCFGRSDEAISELTIVRNLTLMIVAAVAGAASGVPMAADAALSSSGIVGFSLAASITLAGIFVMLVLVVWVRLRRTNQPTGFDATWRFERKG